MKLIFVDDKLYTEYYSIVKCFFQGQGGQHHGYPRRLLMEKTFHIYMIDASKGVSGCMKEFDRIADIYEGDEDHEAVILTNSTDLLNLVYYDNIYLLKFKAEDFIKEFKEAHTDIEVNNVLFKYANVKRIKSLGELCDKEIRPQHNIRNLYLAGEFSEVYTSKRKNAK